MRCNGQIRISPVRLITQDNEQVGIVETEEALRIAREAGLDLVEVAPNVRPPVCRLMDYGKWKYQQKKHVKRHHEQHLKEVRIRPKTDDHDRGIKIDRAIRFFKKGDKVQFTMMFRGRERAHREIGIAIFRRIIDEFGERVKVERPPSMDGRHMIMILAPAKTPFEDVEAPVGGTNGPVVPSETAAPVTAAVDERPAVPSEAEAPTAAAAEVPAAPSEAADQPSA